MEIHRLQIFLTVLETSSLTQAAAKLCLSPGAVSMQLHSLADELGTELFSKTGRRLTPTPAAYRLAERAWAVIQQVRLLQQDFRSDSGEDRRPFHFATGATTLIHRLGKPLRLLRKRYPQRREFFNTTLVIPADRSSLRAKARGLGFRIEKV